LVRDKIIISQNFKDIGIPSNVCLWEIIFRVKLGELLTIENGGQKMWIFAIGNLSGGL